jgi:serine/threonine protein kinase
LTYRAPEVFLDNRHYTEKIDIWSMGLVFYFIITGSTLLNTGSYSDKEMIETIFFIFGAPNEETWPGVTKFDNWKNIYETYNYKFQKKFFEDKLALENSKYYSIVTECLQLNPNDRPNAKNILKCSNILS